MTANIEEILDIKVGKSASTVKQVKEIIYFLNHRELGLCMVLTLIERENEQSYGL